MVFRSLRNNNNPEPSRNSPMASSTTVKPHHQPLHNFSLQDLKWSISSGNSPNQSHPRVRKSSDHSEKKKRVVAVDDAAASGEEKGKLFIRLKAGSGGGKSGDDVVALEEEFMEAKTWNLRPRKAVTKPGPARTELARSEAAQPELTRPKNGVEARGPSGGEKKKGVASVVEEKKKEKFSISLTKEEIEEDVFILTGSKPVRRPKKRPRHVQKCLDNAFPGLWLSTITPESYRVDPHTKG